MKNATVELSKSMCSKNGHRLKVVYQIEYLGNQRNPTDTVETFIGPMFNTFSAAKVARCVAAVWLWSGVSVKQIDTLLYGEGFNTPSEQQ